jgi:hypothetical protein
VINRDFDMKKHISKYPFPNLSGSWKCRLSDCLGYNNRQGSLILGAPKLIGALPLLQSLTPSLRQNQSELSNFSKNILLKNWTNLFEINFTHLLNSPQLRCSKELIIFNWFISDKYEFYQLNHVQKLYLKSANKVDWWIK